MVNFSTKKIKIIAITISYLISFPTIAASYDSQKEGDAANAFSSTNDSLMQQGMSNPFLNNLQQHETQLKKQNYTAVLELIKENKLSDAKNKLNEIINQNNKEPEYFNLQALLAILDKDSPKALNSYKKALELDTNNLMANVGLATHALEIKDLKTAKKHAEIALSVNNQLASAYLLLADIANSQNNIKESETILLNALDKVKGNIKPEIKIVETLTRLYAFQKLPKKILNLSQKLQQQYPNDSKALSLLARAQMLNKQNKLAEQTLNQIIDQNKQDIEHRLLLATFLKSQLDKKTQVLQLLNEVSTLEKNNPRSLVYKATYLIQLKRYTDALAIAKKIDTQFPKLALGKMLESDVYLVEQKYDLALKTNLQAYQIQPNQKLLSTIVALMNKQGQQSKAISFVKNELEKQPKNSALHFKLASLYQNNNDLKSAVQHYKSVLSQTPEHAITLNNLAWIYSQQNNPKALTTAKKAYDINPKSASILDTYGYILVKQGQSKDAINILQKAVALAPKQYDVQFHLAQAYSATGNNKQAISTLSPLLQEDLKFSEKQSAINLFNKLNKN